MSFLKKPAFRANFRQCVQEGARLHIPAATPCLTETDVALQIANLTERPEHLQWERLTGVECVVESRFALDDFRAEIVNVASLLQDEREFLALKRLQKTMQRHGSDRPRAPVRRRQQERVIHRDGARPGPAVPDADRAVVEREPDVAEHDGHDAAGGS